MLKKLTFPILICAIIFQLSILTGMIGYSIKTNNDVEKLGTEYKLAVKISHAVDDTVYFDLKTEENYWYSSYSYSNYACFSVHEDGKVYFSDYSDKLPESGIYIRLDENTKKIFDAFKIDYDNPDLVYFNVDGYLLAKVYNGNILPLELYIEDTPAEDWLKRYWEEIAAKNDDTVDFDDYSVPDSDDDFDFFEDTYTDTADVSEDMR